VPKRAATDVDNAPANTIAQQNSGAYQTRNSRLSHVEDVFFTAWPTATGEGCH